METSWEGRGFIYILKDKKNWGRQRRMWMLSRQQKSIPGRREELPSTGNLVCKSSTGEGDGESIGVTL